MRIIARRTLMQFWKLHPEAQAALEAWFEEAVLSHWMNPAQIKERYPSADILRGNRVVFNIKGNHYRMVVKIHYNTGTVYIRFVGTHAEYDRIDAETV